MAYRKRNVRAYYEQAQRALIKSVAARNQLPLLFFIYSRNQCLAVANSVSNMDFMPNSAARRAAREEFDRHVAAFELDPDDRDTCELRRLVTRGIAYHHAGILPPLKEVIERLFSAGHIRVLCCTETFALGVNMPARSVAFEGIRKWNGVARVPLKTREYQQMAGRAGRRGIDAQGSVYLTFDPFNDDPSLVPSLVNGRVEPVESQFNLSYGTLLNLYDRLGDEIYTACERSFANFKACRAEKAKAEAKAEAKEEKGKDKRSGRHKQARARSKDGSEESGRWRKGRRGRGYARGRRGQREASRQRAVKVPTGRKRYANAVQQVKIKLEILAELGYLDSGDAVTPQGRFAMQVFGHELVVTELVWSGIFDRLTPPKIAVLAGAIVHESRPNVFYGGPSPKKVMSKDAFRMAQRVVGDLVALEEDRGVRTPSKLLDWNMTGVFLAWAEGAKFTELREYSDASDGDVVRALRQAIQVLRLCVRPLRKLGRHAEAGKAKAAKDLLKRGLVDAEWQLRKAAGVPEEEEEEAAPQEEVAVPEAKPDELLSSDEAFSEGLL
jgi:superfamily II RNA helicase